MKTGQIREKWISGKTEGQKMIFRSPVLLAGVAALALVVNASAADLVDTAVAGRFNTLVAAVKAAGLVDALKGPGPFTVFAPTDEAFAKLPPGTLENLLKPENKEQLQRILTYHVVAGQVTAKDVVKLHSAKTLEGESLTVHAGDGGVMVNDASVTKTDIAASNGVIHVIDTVLLPR
jgi:transforming growth factor-beta-induced protein